MVLMLLSENTKGRTYYTTDLNYICCWMAMALRSLSATNDALGKRERGAYYITDLRSMQAVAGYPHDALQDHTGDVGMTIGHTGGAYVQHHGPQLYE